MVLKFLTEARNISSRHDPTINILINVLDSNLNKRKASILYNYRSNKRTKINSSVLNAEPALIKIIIIMTMIIIITLL